ncbi:MAG TPA: glutamate racemase [Vicinamibacterales bacterium]|nr:glutamate racemase [Vicinamibacterales bacterium]
MSDAAHGLDAPVGVFDSGVGGLSVLREIRRELVHENLIYLADSKYAPYGDRDPDYIISRTRAIARFLHDHEAKAIVVACNTATGVAVSALRREWSMPIVGIEPAVKPAVGQTKSGVIGVLSTTQTAASEKFSRLVAEHGGGARILVQSCPGLVEQVERGELDTPETQAMVERFVQPLVIEGADTLVLGCTHYPFLMNAIEKAAGPGVSIIDPAVAVARQLHRRLEAEHLLSDRVTEGTDRFFTTGDRETVEQTIRELWRATVTVTPAVAD